MEDHNRAIEAAKLRLLATYGLVIKALQMLPIPIEVPAVLDSMWTAEIHESLTRTYDLLNDLPMQEPLRAQVKVMVIDWISAADYLFDAQEEFADWKTDFALIQAERITASWHLVKAMHDRK
ncbi:hypothetical protein E1287_07415 [Actinomadura sp. KC06]|uniref:hypothetical protein n=1 Tax=Actinomadura sp. KC06 TaxID=2530369 RepID=UPI00104ACB31|nr:hypothetical protein [Actinomadura sp. KC06]TDD37876.1 hypothetical protein E1287_07415 [Actinomadura sp. KC06]